MPRATDMISEMATAIANGLTAEQLRLAMRAHPTYSEALWLLLKIILKQKERQDNDTGADKRT